MSIQLIINKQIIQIAFKTLIPSYHKFYTNGL